MTQSLRKFSLMAILCVSVLSGMNGLARAETDELKRALQVGLAVDSVDGGVEVILAPDHQPAGRAGILAGDLIRSMNGEPLQAQADISNYLRQQRPDEIRFELERDGESLSITVQPQPVPMRESPDFEVLYGSVATEDGVLRRTLTIRPPGDGPFPTIVMLGGIGCYSLDRSDDFPYIRLLDDMARAGYQSFWVEKSGMGDSQGAPCMEIDFQTEISGYRAGLAQVRTMAEVDQDRIILLGHSMGGIVGPVLAAEAAAAEEPLHAVIAMATAGIPWFEYLVANSRRQLNLTDLTPAAVESAMREVVTVHYRYTIEKHAPEDIIADFPDRAGNFQLPHHYTYFQQVADISPATYWAATETPALLVAGGADFAVSREEHQYVTDIINELRPGSARFLYIEDMNHGLSRSRDARAARAGETEGFHPDLVPAILEWLRSLES